MHPSHALLTGLLQLCLLATPAPAHQEPADESPLVLADLDFESAVSRAERLQKFLIILWIEGFCLLKIGVVTRLAISASGLGFRIFQSVTTAARQVSSGTSYSLLTSVCANTYHTTPLHRRCAPFRIGIALPHPYRRTRD